MTRLLVAAGALLLAFLAGCSSGSEPKPGSHLEVYLGAPLSGPEAKGGRACAGGARAVLEEAGSAAAGIEVGLTVLDAWAASAGDSAAVAGDNARVATQDSTSIAYLGETDSALTRTSLPITNDAGLLQVSPARPAPELLSPFEGSDEVPDETQPSGARTFGALADPGSPRTACAAALAVALDAIERAEDPLSRGSVVEAFLAAGEHESAAGPYTVDEVGLIDLDGP